MLGNIGNIKNSTQKIEPIIFLLINNYVTMLLCYFSLKPLVLKDCSGNKVMLPS